MGREGTSRWDMVEGLKARALALWADQANYTYQDIALMLNNEFRSTTPEHFLGLTKGVMAKFYFDTGMKRFRNASGGRPKAERKVDVRTARSNKDGPARQRAERMHEAKKRARKDHASKLEHVERETVSPGSGLWPKRAFDPMLWGKPTIGLRKLSAEMCKWPFEYEDGRHRYCGAKATILVYCLHHASMAYRQPPSEAREATKGKAGYEDERQRASARDAQERDDAGEPYHDGEHDRQQTQAASEACEFAPAVEPEPELARDAPSICEGLSEPTSLPAWPFNRR